MINNAKTAGQIINANNADKATTSTNVENIIATEQAYPNIISFSIGDKSYSKTVNHVENAKTINRSIESNEEVTLLHAEGSTDGFNLKWASGEDAGTLTIETTDDANSQIRFLQNDVQVLQAIDGKCNINGNANSATYTASNTSETIESRLTRLGFKHAQFYGQNIGNLDLEFDMYKLGNYVKCFYRMTYLGSLGAVNLNDVILIEGKMPSEFIPITDRSENGIIQLIKSSEDINIQVGRLYIYGHNSSTPGRIGVRYIESGGTAPGDGGVTVMFAFAYDVTDNNYT